MKYICYLIFCFSIINSYAISISGHIIDAANKQPLEGVNVFLAVNDSITISHSLTLKDGSFTINVPQRGDYLLMISHVSYQSLKIALTNIQNKMDLGTFDLSASTVSLDEVVVSSKDYTKIDRQILFPTAQTIALSFTGLEVIEKMMLHGIMVNTTTNNISSSLSSRPVQLRINDVPVTIDEVVSVNPLRIIKIEYIDLPGLRYGDVGAVINLILKKPEKGFSIGGSTRTALTSLYSNNSVNIKYNNKLSEFGLNYNFFYSDFPDCYTDERQIFQLPDYNLELIKTGIKSPNKTTTNNIALSYNWNYNEKIIFNTIFRNRLASPDNFASQLINDGLNNIKYNSFLNTKDRNYSPALDTYFQYSLDNKQTFIANFVTTYISSDYQRIYQEFGEDDQLRDDLSYDTKGKRYSLLSELDYENKLSKTTTFSSGINFSQAYTENLYLQQNNKQTRNSMNTSEVYGFAQLQGSLQTFVYQIGFGYSRQTFNETNGNYAKYSFRPSISLSYSPKATMSFRYRFYILPYIPNLSDLSDFKQFQNEYEVYVGNPSLKPFNSYANTLMYDYHFGRFSIMSVLYYQYNSNNIMNTIQRIEENGNYYFEYSKSNQKSFQHLQERLFITAELIKNRLSATVGGAINRYMNFGNKYTNCFTGYFGMFQLQGNYNNWSLSSSFALKSKMLFNETLFTNSMDADISLRYRHGNFQYGFEMLNPFLHIGNPSTQELISQYVYKESTTYNKNYGNMVRFIFAWNLNFGRKYNSTQKQINQSDEDSGIVK
jgi:hypothetical protein